MRLHISAISCKSVELLSEPTCEGGVGTNLNPPLKCGKCYVI